MRYLNNKTISRSKHRKNRQHKQRTETEADSGPVITIASEVPTTSCASAGLLLNVAATQTPSNTNQNQHKRASKQKPNNPTNKQKQKQNQPGLTTVSAIVLTVTPAKRTSFAFVVNEIVAAPATSASTLNVAV